MATGKIAQYKIDAIATHLVEDYRTQITNLTEKLSSEYVKRATALLPTKVQECLKEHPEYMYTSGYVYLQGLVQNKRSIHIPTEVIKLANGDTAPISAQDKVELGAMVDKIVELEKTRDTLKNKSVCAIEKIKTYKRLEAEFPEAYKILVEKVDRGDVKSDTICDTVESLRAELGVTEKK